jgi:hypothetical protein
MIGFWRRCVNAFMKALLKVTWSRGGAADDVDGLPRLRAEDIDKLVPQLEGGDLILIGNGGGLSHVAVYTGDGAIIHSMATEHTMRGTVGTLWDAVKRPFRWMVGIEDKAGVIEEGLAEFVERFERDTYVAVRHPGLTDEGRVAGIAKIESLIGKRYDYDFTQDDDEYYCTEIAIEFLKAAGHDLTFETKHVKVPLLLDTHVYEPITLLQHEALKAVVASSSANSQFGDNIKGATLLHK